jgi:hypothetical protein
LEEALVNAVQTTYDDTITRVLSMEYLMAVCLQTRRQKDKERIIPPNLYFALIALAFSPFPSQAHTETVKKASPNTIKNTGENKSLSFIFF